MLDYPANLPFHVGTQGDTPMGLENRRSGNASEGSNPSLSASFCADQPVSAMRMSRCSAPVPADTDGTRVGTVTGPDNA